jgi:hypothetical protein
MRNTRNFKHLANAGDVISIMAAMKRFYENTGRKVIFYQQLNVPGAYPIGSRHPSVNDKGVPVCMNNLIFKMLRPLLLWQEYIEDVRIYKGQQIDIDLDVIRQKTYVNLGYMAIQQWPMLAFPDLATDLSKPWLSVDRHTTDFSDKIVCNFTDRYRNHVITYFFLKKYQEHLIFAGTETEYRNFCEEWDLKMPLLVVKDFLELAQVIKGCMFLLSNQSLNWNIAEGMKTPRILEMSPQAPNCQPFIGEDSYGFFHQIGLEYYVELLFNKYKK